MATFMFEVYYQPPEDPALELKLQRIVEKHDGWLDFEEKTNKFTICLAYEFNLK